MTFVIYYWNEAPIRRKSSGRVRFPAPRYGHVSLAVRKDAVTIAYWSWWPGSFTNVREAKKSRKSFWEKVKKTAREWILSEPGRRSLSYDLADAANLPEYQEKRFPRPDQIDTVLITNDAMGTSESNWESNKWTESRATVAYRWNPKYPHKGLQEIKRLIVDAHENKETYHFLGNNCATTVARILAAGGLPIWRFIWSPLLIKVVCIIGRFERVPT